MNLQVIKIILWQYPDWYEDLKEEAKKQETMEFIFTKRICSMESWS